MGYLNVQKFMIEMIKYYIKYIYLICESIDFKIKDNKSGI